VHEYVAVSAELASWLVSVVGVSPERVHYIPNGVDAVRFTNATAAPRISRADIGLDGRFLVGTVGRMADVKNQTDLVDAFIALLLRRADLRSRTGLVLVGDGPLRAACMEKLKAAAFDRAAWIPGERDDIPEIMRLLDVFVLPSLAEGMSNTILEAMASGLPVIATDVGGNRELVQNSVTGLLVPPGNVDALALAIERYCDDQSLAKRHGDAGQDVIAGSFSLDRMVESYVFLYRSLVSRLPR
jgi:sugar transferase (PEP-CTERM/EpsH1 system associated)